MLWALIRKMNAFKAEGEEMNEELRKEIEEILSWHFNSWDESHVIATRKLLALLGRECDRVALESAKKAKEGMWGTQRCT